MELFNNYQKGLLKKSIERHRAAQRKKVKAEFNYLLENCKLNSELDYILDFIMDCKKMFNLK